MLDLKFSMNEICDFSAMQGNGLHAGVQAGVRGFQRGELHVRPMFSGEESSVLDVLNLQPVRNVIIIGLVLDNGLESAKNRGVWYGCFVDDSLVGVALIGHHVFLSGNDESAKAFADIARLNHESEVQIILGEQPLADAFYHSFNAPPASRPLHSDTDHLLLSSCRIKSEKTKFMNLRRARPEETEEIAKINSGAFMELYGIDPEISDPDGFRQRLRSRVEMGRVWVLRDAGGIAFKAEVPSSTNAAAYLEGILTRPEIRGTGVGSIALQSLCAQLLEEHKVLCLLADAANPRTVSFYRNIGFAPLASYRLIRYQN
jgi:GNAT superfamily N-acetyltransferase